jgi:CBS domain-containing protein
MDTAADIMTSPVVRIPANASVAEGLALMREKGVSGLLADPVDPEDSFGFFSQTDAIEKIIAPQRDPTGVTVAQVMSRPVITVPPQTAVQDCALVMHKAHIRRVLVHDGHDVVGIVSASDVLEAHAA